MSPNPLKLKPVDNLEESDYTINQLEDEEMDVDLEENLGYSPLQSSDNQEIPANDSTDEESDDDDDDDDNDDNMEENEYIFQQQPPPNVPQITSSDVEIQAKIWNEPRKLEGIELTKETSQQITQIMSKIKLPIAPPAWVNEMSIETLFNRLKNNPDGSDFKK